MSNVIDSKVVEMLFDNSKFESNVQTSMSSLDKLKKSLDMDGVSKGLDEVADGTRQLNFNFFGESVDNVKNKFSAFEQVAIGALRRIGEQAVEAGEKFVKSLTIDQVASGWSKYAEKTSSVQTIMAATRKEFAGAENQMELVNDQLDRLNWFTDETSYNFLDMVNNIGKFTANNVKLDQSVAAMQGIATWGAMSGANVQEVSRAMYNMSQSLSVGAVKLMDWKSIENANMATAEFKETAIETAINLGTLKKSADGVITTLDGKETVTVETFSQTLQKQWFNKDVLLKTLDTYGGFANKLYDYTQETGTYTTEFLKYLDAFESGFSGDIKMEDIVKETGISSERLTEIFTELTSKTYELGRRSFSAAQEAKTFGEAIDSVKDAASTGFMNMFETIFGNYEEAKVLWTDLANSLYDVVIEPINGINDTLDVALSKTTLETYISRMTGLSGEAATNLVKLAREAGVTSEEFQNLTSELFNNDPAMQKLVTNVLGAASGMEELDMSSVNGEIATMTKQSPEAIEKLREIGETAGYGSDEFRAMAFELTHGNEQMTNTITNLMQMSSEMDGLTGRERLIKSFWNIWEYVGHIIAPIKEAFDNIFPPITASRVFDLTKKIEAFTDSLTVSEETADRLRRIFEGFFSIFKIGKQILDAVLIPFKDLFARLKESSGTIDETVASWADWIKELADSGKVAEKATEIFTKISSVFQRAVDFALDFLNISKTVLGYYEGGGGIAGVFNVIVDKVSAVVDFVLDAFSKITGIDVSGVKEKVLGFLSNAKEKIVEFLPSQEELIAGWEKLKKVLEKVKKPFETVVNFIKAKLEAKGYEKFRDVVDDIKEKLSGATDKLKPFKTILEALKKLASSLFKAFKGLAPVFQEIIKGAGNLFGSLLEGIANFFNNLDFSNLAEGIKTVISTIFAGAGISSILGGLSDIVDLAHLNIVDNIVGMLDTLKSTLKSFQESVQAKTLIKIATAIGILALSMLVIASIDPGKMMGAVGAMEIMLLELISAGKMIGKTKINKSSAFALIEIAIAMVVIATALKKMGDISWESIVKGIVAFGIIMAEISIAMGNMPKLGAKDKAFAMLEVAAALILVAIALEKMGDISWESIIKGIVAFGLIMIEISIALKNMPTIGAASKGFAMIEVAAALILVAIALQKMGDISWESIIKGVVAFGLIMFEISIALDNMPNGFKALAGALAMVEVSATLLIIALAIKKIGELSWESILKGIVTFGIVLAEITIALNNLGLTSVVGAASILIVVAALSLLIPVLMALGQMTWGEIGKGLLTIAGVFLVLGVAGYALQPVVGTILALSAALLMIGVASVAFGAGLMLISLALTSFAISAEVVATSIVTIIGILINALPELIGGLAESLGYALPAIIDMITSIGSAALEAIKTLAPELVDTLLTLLSGVLTSLAANIQPIIEGLIGVLVGIFNGLAAGIPAMTEAFFNIINAVITGVQTSLGSLDIGTIISAIGALTLMVVAMGLLTTIALLGLAATLTLPTIGANLSNFMESVQPFLSGIAAVDPQAITGAKTLAETVLILTAASILDALTSWFTGGQSMINFGKQLAEFAPYLKEYASAISGIDAGVVEASANAGKALAEMANAMPNQGGIASLFAGDNNLAKIAKELKPFGEAMVEYSNTVSGKIDDAAIIASTNAGKAIAEMSNSLPNQGGVVSWFTGDNNLAKIAEQLKPFGTAMADYSAEVSGKIDEGAITASVNSAKLLSDMAGNLPNQGGVVSWFTGDNSLEKIAKELKPFGTAMAEYSAEVSGKIDEGSIAASVNSAKLISGMADNLPNQGGVVSWFTGDNSLASIAEQLKPFGTAMADYSAEVSGKIDEGAIAASVNSAILISGMADSLPNEGGVVSWFTGDNNLAKIAEQLKPFGTAMADYSAEVSGKIDEGAIAASVNSAKLLSGMASNLPDQGGLVSWFAGDNSIDDFGEGLKTLGQDLAAYSESVKDIDAESISAASEKMNELADLGKKISDIGSSGLNGFVQALSDIALFGINGFIEAITEGTQSIMSSIDDLLNQITSSITNGSGSIRESVTTLKQTMIESFDDAPESFDKIGKSLSSSINSGFDSNKQTIINTAQTTVRDMASACRDVDAHAKAESAGKYLGDGFIGGLNSKKSAASTAGKQLGMAAINGLNAALQINSPSKLAAKSGDWFGIGFTDELLSFADKAYDSAHEVGDGAAKGLNDAINKVINSSPIGSDDPFTIRPVLDLTEIQNGADRIHGMMDGYSISGTAAIAGQASNSMNRMNGASEESLELSKLTDSIKDLISNQGSTQNNTFNINGTSDPEEVAERVAQILAQQIKRRDALWA